MSKIVANSIQIGQSATAANNVLITVPATPDGSMTLGNGAGTNYISFDTAGTVSATTGTFSGAVGVGAAVAAGDAVQLGYFTPIDNSAAVSDISLGVGQSAFIDFTSATSIPLHLATSTKQIYELDLQIDSGAAAGNLCNLNPNNTTYASAIIMMEMYGASTGPATAATVADSAFRLSVAGTPYIVSGRFIIAGTTGGKHVVSGRDSTATVGYAYTISSAWSGTAWTSLGTIACATALTGRATVRRIA